MILHLLRCQGFAVPDYGFTLGRLESEASSTFATSGYRRRPRRSTGKSRWLVLVPLLRCVARPEKAGILPQVKNKKWLLFENGVLWKIGIQPDSCYRQWRPRGIQVFDRTVSKATLKLHLEMRWQPTYGWKGSNKDAKCPL